MGMTPKPMLFALDTYVKTSFKEGRQATHSHLEEIWQGIPKLINLESKQDVKYHRKKMKKDRQETKINFTSQTTRKGNTVTSV